MAKPPDNTTQQPSQDKEKDSKQQRRNRWAWFDRKAVITALIAGLIAVFGYPAYHTLFPGSPPSPRLTVDSVAVIPCAETSYCGKSTGPETIDFKIRNTGNQAADIVYARIKMQGFATLRRPTPIPPKETARQRRIEKRIEKQLLKLLGKRLEKRLGTERFEYLSRRFVEGIYASRILSSYYLRIDHRYPVPLPPNSTRKVIVVPLSEGVGTNGLADFQLVFIPSMSFNPYGPYIPPSALQSNIYMYRLQISIIYNGQATISPVEALIFLPKDPAAASNCSVGAGSRLCQFLSSPGYRSPTLR